MRVHVWAPLTATPACLQKRVNVAAMASQGSGAGSVFDARDMFLKERRKLDERRKQAEGASPMQVPPPPPPFSPNPTLLHVAL